MQHTDNNPTFSVCTLGCKVNQYESQAISEDLERRGFSLRSFDEKCDVYIINTCTVTAESDRKSRQMIRRAVKCGGGNAIVIVVGCFSQAESETVGNIPGVTAAFGTADKSKVASYAADLFQKQTQGETLVFENKVFDLSEADRFDETFITHSERTRAFVKIVDGCENHCSYCIIPRVRGKIRSRRIDSIIRESETLVAHGYKEIVLTGIETAAFGKDTGETLSELLRQMNEIPGIERIRLGSLEPTLLRKDFIQTAASLNHVVPHFHLSLQSGCDAVLRGMRRKYNTAMFREMLDTLRLHIPTCTVTTDIIVGFPGETDEMFRETCDFVRECAFLYVHIFPYSPREGTAATEFPNQVPENIKKQRAAELHDVMIETRKKVLRFFDGVITSVLLEETDEENLFNGHTPHYIEVKLMYDSTEDLRGKIFPCKLIYNPETTDYVYGVPMLDLL